jgi:squalene-hopene/tetraprenyl-beta-curcumene cyclase
MSLASAGMKNHAVVAEGSKFLRASMRPDGSWPIDTNLSTWVTTLSVNALGEHRLDADSRQAIREWLLAQQYQEEHPYTHAAPGGWAWTPLPGGVPDADDTAGALLALWNLGGINDRVQVAAENGIRWLLGLQNRDGGMPTFCRGWGKLPFDRSGSDLTAHALSAWRAWLPHLHEPLRSRTQRAIARAVAFLARAQSTDGSWTPLWFGSERNPREENPAYGTARASIALAGSKTELLDPAVRWLHQAQNSDGGWGSIEEGALAIHALAATSTNGAALERGVRWLIQATDEGTRTPVAPIGLYFARLWYFEELYPLIFATGAAIRVTANYSMV